MLKLQKKCTSLFLTVLIAMSSFSTIQINAMMFEESVNLPDQRSFELSILLSTLEEPIGMQGFEGEYAINNPYEIVEIIVEFSTPSAVALRLLQEYGYYSLENLPGISFENQALTAHYDFQQQLAQIPTPFGNNHIEIFSEHYWLFNGVFMRVPGSMVEQISTLAGVYGVFPNISFDVDHVDHIDEEYSEDSSTKDANYYVNYEYETDTFYDYIDYEYGTNYTINYPNVYYYIDSVNSSFFVNPNFMGLTREFLEIDAIHSELGITGAGVRVAVLDTGIYHNHPEFARFLDNTGRIPGWHFWHDYNPMNNHGTIVSGAVIGIAPGIDLWHYRVALAGTGGGGTSIGAIEAAHRDGADVITMSFGAAQTNHPFAAISGAINRAVLDGVVVISSAGNSGLNGNFTITSPGPEPLLITVGAGTAGGTQQASLGDDVITRPRTWGSSLGPVQQTFHIKPDIIAPTYVNTTNMGGGYAIGNGTSSAAPVIAGVAALLLEAFPDASPQEIKARIMNSARPLENLSIESVFAVGAGFVQPIEALTRNGNTFATAEHLIPVSTNSNAPFEMNTMSSLSFGRFYGYSIYMPITIHNPGSGVWTPQISFNGEHEGVNLSVLPSGQNTFSANMTFASSANVGLYEGDIVFTNGERRITMPFAVMFEGGGNDVVLRGLFGDVNGDGQVDLMDVTLLMLYLAGYPVEIIRANADVNVDGVLDILDLMLIRLYLAGHDVVFGPQ